MNAAQLLLVREYVRAHPKAVARRLEAAPPAEAAELLRQIGSAEAADLLESMVPLAAAQALSQARPEHAADMVESMEPLHIAPLLRRLSKSKADAILAELNDEKRLLVGRLMSYAQDQAASRMDPRAPAASLSMTAEQALDGVRRAADGALNYVYVIDDKQKLVGVVSMRELLAAPPTALVNDIMTEDPTRIFADEPLKNVVSHPGWQRAHALPVVGRDNLFLGVMRYSAFRALEAELGRAKSSVSTSATAGALAELFWVGTSAMGRLAETVVLGEDSGSKKEQS